MPVTVSTMARGRTASMKFTFIGVLIVPGTTQFAWMPYGAHSTASCRVSASIPPLVAAYDERPGRRRDFCHSADTPVSIPIELPAKGRGGCSRMTVSPPAREARAVLEAVHRADVDDCARVGWDERVPQTELENAATNPAGARVAQCDAIGETVILLTLSLHHYCYTN